MSTEKESLDIRFFEFHRNNPEIFDLLFKFANRARLAGHRHYSIDAIMHQVRWHFNVETKATDGFKLNNNYTSRYARLLMMNHPELKGFFRNRELRTETILP